MEDSCPFFRESYFQYFPVGTPGLLTQQGTLFTPIPNPANGKLPLIVMSLGILAKMEVGYRGRLCHPASSDLFAAIPHGRRDSLCALSVHAETGKRVPNTFSTEGACSVVSTRR
jgi:hypothetical protein